MSKSLNRRVRATFALREAPWTSTQTRGLYAIKSVGLYAKFQEKVRDGGEGMRVVDAVSGEVLLMDEGGGGEGGGVGDRPEIDR